MNSEPVVEIANKSASTTFHHISAEGGSLTARATASPNFFAVQIPPVLTARQAQSIATNFLIKWRVPKIYYCPQKKVDEQTLICSSTCRFLLLNFYLIPYEKCGRGLIKLVVHCHDYADVLDVGRGGVAVLDGELPLRGVADLSEAAA